MVSDRWANEYISAVDMLRGPDHNDILFMSW
jgi:hypothetical protein